jgi:hypothetical protein
MLGFDVFSPHRISTKSKLRVDITVNDFTTNENFW